MPVPACAGQSEMRDRRAAMNADTGKAYAPSEACSVRGSSTELMKTQSPLRSASARSCLQCLTPGRLIERTILLAGKLPRRPLRRESTIFTLCYGPTEAGFPPSVAADAPARRPMRLPMIRQLVCRRRKAGISRWSSRVRVGRRCGRPRGSRLPAAPLARRSAAAVAAWRTPMPGSAAVRHRGVARLDLHARRLSGTGRRRRLGSPRRGA